MRFRPVPRLVVPQSGITAPCRPFIDAHNHLGQFGGGWDARPPAALFDRLDQARVLHYVDLDGGWGEDVLEDRLRRYKAHAPDRYRVYLFEVPTAEGPLLGDRLFLDAPELAARELGVELLRGEPVWEIN